MYLCLDRRVGDIGEPQRFLLAAMRLWVESARGGHCPCAALAGGFARRGIALAVRDFAMAMAALDRDGLGRLRLNLRNAPAIAEDEARLLGLFDAARMADSARVRRIAATLVDEEAVGRLAIAAEWVALHLSDGAFLEQDR